MIISFWVFILSILNVSIRGAYYVNSSASNISPDGTREKPFISLEQVVTRYGNSTAEVILLGNSLFLNGTLNFTSGANFIIKPEALSQGQRYFQVSLRAGANIRASLANLTFEDIEFIELDTTRTSSNQPFLVTDTHLTLRRILVRNINYATSYQFIRTRQTIQGPNPYEFNLIDSEFIGTRNLQMFGTTVKSTVSGCNFTNITQETAPIILLTTLLGPSNNFTLKNVVFQNCVIGNILTGGFIVVGSSATSIITDRLTLKNLTFTAGYTFLSFSANSQSTNYTSLTVSNWDIDGVYEQPIPSSILQATAMILNCPNLESFTIINFKANNIRLRSKWMIYFASVCSLFQNKWLISPSANLKNLAISNSTGSIAYIRCMDNVVVEDIWLENTSYFNTSAAFYLFRFEIGHKIKVKNVQTKNNIGPLLRIQDYMNQEVADSELQDTLISQDINLKYPNIISLERKNAPSALGLKSNQENTTNIQNITIKGFKILSETGITIYNSTSLMTVDSYFGKVYIKDLMWKNIQVKGMSSTRMKYIEIENATMDFDPVFVSPQVPNHLMFEFLDAENVTISKSRFINNPNFQIFRFYNAKKMEEYDTFIMPTLYFQNLIVNNNNNLNYLDSNPIETLLKFYAAFIPIQITISNSSFQNNIINNGLIQIDESYKVDIFMLENNFTNNYAKETGTILRGSRSNQNSNTVLLRNNIMTNNSCSGDGGLFYFSSSSFKFTASNNSYINTTARNGGVGIVTKSTFLYSEEGGVYLGNSARGYGGCWYLNILRDNNKLPRIQWSNTSFIDSKGLNGGTIYIFSGDVLLNSCSFKGSQAVVSGGDFLLAKSCSLTISSTKFSESSAKSGAFLYGESLAGETVFLENVNITDAKSEVSGANLLKIFKGSMKLSKVFFKNITYSLFNFNGASVQFNNVVISQITCATALSTCLMEGSSTNISLFDTWIGNIISNKELITLQKSKNIIFQNLTIVDAQVLEGLDPSNQLFGLTINQASSFILRKSTFQRLGLSVVKIKNSTVEISETNFSNKLDKRILQETGGQDLETTKLNYQIQFLNLDSANCSLTKTSFIENAFNKNLNGGAVRILGTGGNYKFSECFFENNQASSGGAISLEGNTTSFKIENSTFVNNKASFGGALSLNSQSAREVILLTQSMFLQNNATYGGGIHIGNQKMILENSTLRENTASRGGGIASFSPEKDSILLQNIVFSKNKAVQGPALMVFGEMTYKYDTVKFENNIAEVGEDLSTKPFKLRLKIYEVNKVFLFIQNVTLDYILNYPDTKLIYDSMDTTLHKTLLQQSGVNPNFVFEFSLLDGADRTLSIFEKADVQFSIKSYSESTSTIQPSLLGNLAYSIDNKTTYVFDSIAVRGDFGTNIILSAQSSFINTLSGQLEYTPPVEWNVVIAPCQVGEIYDSVNSICSVCPQGTYTFDDPLKAQTCLPCFNSAKCLGGGIIYPKEGYWRMDSQSDRMIRCLNENACLGGESDGGRNISLTGFCDSGYEGIACSACREGYAKFGFDQTCINCKTNVWYYIKLVGFLFLQIVLLVVMIRVHLTNHKNASKESDSKTYLLLATLLKIIVDFVQIVSLTLEFNFHWPPEVDILLNISTKSVQTSRDAFSVDCFIALIKMNNRDIFYTKLLLYTLQPFLYMILVYLLWLIWLKITKTKPNNKDFKDKVKLSAIITIYILQPNVLKVIFQVFNCINFGSSKDPKYFLIEDTNEECWTPKHLAWSLGVGIPSLVIWLILPYGFFIYWVRKIRKSESKSMKLKFSFILEKYNPNSYLWELVIISQKVLLIVISVFFASNYLQAYLSSIVLFLFFQLQFRVFPYFDKKLNTVESFGRCSSSLVMFSGLYFLKEDISDLTLYSIFTFDVLSGVAFFGYAIYICLIIVKDKIGFIIKKIDKFIATRRFLPVFIKKAYKRIRAKTLTKLALDLDGSLESPKLDIQSQEAKLELKNKMNLSASAPDDMPSSLIISNCDEEDVSAEKSPQLRKAQSNVAVFGRLASKLPYFRTFRSTAGHKKSISLLDFNFPSSELPGTPKIIVQNAVDVSEENHMSSILSPSNKLLPVIEMKFLEKYTPRRIPKNTKE